MVEVDVADVVVVVLVALIAAKDPWSLSSASCCRVVDGVSRLITSASDANIILF